MMTSSSKWKSGLLKTGLPLEYVTSNILSKLKHEVCGEYPYLRPNEKKEFEEFSVDMLTYKCLDSSNKLITLSMLVECKYRHPGTFWIFSPFPSEMIPIGLVQSTEDIVPVRFNWDYLYGLENRIGYCISGVELTEDGCGNTNGTKHGIFQLRFAMPVLLKSEYEYSLEHIWSEGRYVNLIFPVLVTTSEIRIIKPGLSLDSFTSAKNIDEITEVREAIILNEQPGPQLKEFADSLANEFIKNHPELDSRLNDLSSILVGKEWKSRVPPDSDSIKRSFSNSTERILIVSFKSFSKTIKNIETAIRKEIANQKIYGKIIKTKTGLLINNSKD